MKITENTLPVSVKELRRDYGATEASRICVSCDAPFFPHRATTDVCSRCEQRRTDRLAGAKLTAWVMAALFFTLLAIASRMHGASVVTEQFLDGIAQRESRNNPAAIGRHGERGAYQLRPCAVQEVNNKMGWDYSHRVAAVKFGRVYAKAYCLYLERRLSNALGRSPTQPEVYNAYRLGPSGYIRTVRRNSKHSKPSAVRGVGEFRRICAVTRAFAPTTGAELVSHGASWQATPEPYAVGWSRGDAFRCYYRTPTCRWGASLSLEGIDSTPRCIKRHRGGEFPEPC